MFDLMNNLLTQTNWNHKSWMKIIRISLLWSLNLFNIRLKINRENKLTTISNKITNKVYNKPTNIKHLIQNHRIKVYSNLIFREPIIMKPTPPRLQPNPQLRIDWTPTWTLIRSPKQILRSLSRKIASSIMQRPQEKCHLITLASFQFIKPRKMTYQIVIIITILRLLKMMMKDLKSLLISQLNHQN